MIESVSFARLRKYYYLCEENGETNTFSTMKTKLFFLLIILAWRVGVYGTSTEWKGNITFTVSVNNLSEHYVDVQMDCRNIEGDELILKLPLWAPGYYILLDYPRNIYDFTAKTSKGKSLKWEKLGNNVWKIRTKGKSDVKVHYRVLADSWSVAEANMSSDHLFLPGNGVFMHPEGGVNHPSIIKFVNRHGWKHIMTGLKRTETTKDTTTFYAGNFDVLYDSPFFWGNPTVRSFEFEGHQYDVSLQGDLACGLDSLCTDLRKIIHAATELMGDVPFDRYAFLFLGPGNGGLEHWNSQADFLDISSMNEYKSSISFIAHEYFHLYNVKAIHPVELGPFNYDGECYTNCLWLSEGATVFYEYYLCNKAGLLTRQEMLDFLAKTFKVFESREGKNHMTLAQSSHDIWKNFFNFGGNSGDTQISYYEKGPAVVLLFDCAIRYFSKGKKSFDDVMRQLYWRYYKQLGRGFTEDELNALIREVAAPADEKQQAMLDEIFSYIYTTKSVDYNRFLEPIGLHWDAATYTIRSIETISAAISEKDVRDQVGYLASDAMNGRQAGSEGGYKAADYLVHYLDSLGIKPLDGNYRHPFKTDPFNYVRYSAGIHNDRAAAKYKVGNDLCNVIAVIEGKNPNEIVIAGAHYDHVGAYHGLMAGDCIFNGADDNASGTVALMQVAKTFATCGIQPEKTLILAFWDGEERNCKGSEHFVRNYPKMKAIKHCLNIDMVGRGTADSIACICSDADRDVYLHWVSEAIEHCDLRLDVTPESEYGVGDDSDQRIFHEAGIPCLWFFSGEHEDVHTPFDEVQKLNTQKITDVAKTAFLVLWHMCN